MKAGADSRAWRGLVRGSGAYSAWVAAVVLLFVVYVLRTTIEDPDGWRANLIVGGVCAGVSLALMWCARLVWRQDARIPFVTLRAILAGAIGYHALFGVFLMLGRVKSRVTSNDDLVMVVWPHVVHWVNSFE